jgi:hypothetical protein
MPDGSLLPDREMNGEWACDTFPAQRSGAGMGLWWSYAAACSRVTVKPRA